MKVKVRGKNFELRELDKKYISNKISDLEKAIGNDELKSEVIVSKFQKSIKFEFVISGKDKVYIKDEVVNEELDRAVSIAIEKAEKRLKSLKNKAYQNVITEYMQNKNKIGDRNIESANNVNRNIREN